ncbi:MAG: hypothetical protein AB1568_15265 [Thermodesulfobacteriota bacterium]
MQIKKSVYLLCLIITFALSAAIVTIFCDRSCDGELRPGDRYRIDQPIYLMAVYNSLDNKEISRETSRAYLHTKRYYNKSSVAFQCETPIGTTMTVISPAPKVWHLPFLASRYFVQLEPDLSHGLDVILELTRGIEGDLDGLNPKLFSRMK